VGNRLRSAPTPFYNKQSHTLAAFCTTPLVGTEHRKRPPAATPARLRVNSVWVWVLCRQCPFNRRAPHDAPWAEMPGEQFRKPVASDQPRARARDTADLSRPDIGIVSAFDANRNLIEDTAAKVYARDRRGFYELSPKDF
jgi:hypothetical protein